MWEDDMKEFGIEKQATHEKLQPLVVSATVSNMLTASAGGPLTGSEGLQQVNADERNNRK